jgi:hypothetical protein
MTVRLKKEVEVTEGKPTGTSLVVDGGFIAQ